MRITNNMMIDKFLVNMQTNLTKMDRYTSQLSSGRKIVRLSDDAVGVYNALTARQRLARVEQYQRNITTARNWVEQIETSLQDISSKMAVIREQNIYSGGVVNDGDRQNIAVLMVELKNTIMDALNNTTGIQYVFAGHNVLNQPITEGTNANGDPILLYNGIDLTDLSAENLARIETEQSQHFSLEVGFGLNMDVSMTAIDVLGKGDENIFKIADDIIDLMNNGTADGSDVVEQLSGYLDDLALAHENVTSCLVRVGAMTTQLDILENRYSQDEINYNDMRSKIEDIDSAETIMDWKMAEAVYKQSLATGARVIMPTLMDFLN